ncbi:hypothetical protein JL722_4084 [Aureococcus anophagefferens]|nr:hypothetical protein JL722_4084 [Aureococcus anophagefferens]
MDEPASMETELTATGVEAPSALVGEREHAVSWRQPRAIVPYHSKVTEFLRGPGKTFTYSSFEGLRHARNWRLKHFGEDGGYNAEERHSATAREGGRGAKAFVIITKTYSSDATMASTEDDGVDDPYAERPPSTFVPPGTDAYRQLQQQRGLERMVRDPAILRALLDENFSQFGIERASSSASARSR